MIASGPLTSFFGPYTSFCLIAVPAESQPSAHCGDRRPGWDMGPGRDKSPVCFLANSSPNAARQGELPLGEVAAGGRSLLLSGCGQTTSLPAQELPPAC